MLQEGSLPIFWDLLGSNKSGPIMMRDMDLSDLQKLVYTVAELKVEGLDVTRCGKLILHQLGFHATQCSILHITGENGVGKSTLLRTLAGFIKPHKGAIIYQDHTGLALDNTYIRASQIHYLGHTSGIKPHFTLRQDLTFHRNLAGYNHQADIEDILGQTGLKGLGDMACGFLSAGQQKRLAVARLLAVPKQIWLLDEPFAALDANGQALVSDIIEYHCQSGGLVLLVNHQPLQKQIAHQTLQIEPLKASLPGTSSVLFDDEMFL